VTVRKVLAMMRASWQVASSYKLNMVWSLVGLVASVIPVFFVTRALQPMMESKIQDQGGEFFAFVLVGQIAMTLLTVAVTTLPGTISASIASGTLELLLSTPTRLPTLVAGMIGYSVSWTAVRCALILLVGWVLGATIAWDKFLIAVGILGIIVLTYLSVGIVVAALVLAFRFTGPLTKGVLLSSALLGGVYYPTQVIPSWIQRISDVIPLTYGLRALRGVLLDDAPLSAVTHDLGILSLFCVVLLSLSSLSLVKALQYSKQAGTLSQY
jgi:ABC-2 type transport system permease protein